VKTLALAVFIAVIASFIFDKETQDMSYPTSRTFARRTWERDPHEMATCVYKPQRRGDRAVIWVLVLAAVPVVVLFFVFFLGAPK
jgi:hypothetical protein